MPAETVRGGAVAEAFAGAEDEHCFVRVAWGALNRSERSVDWGGFGWFLCVCESVLMLVYIIEVYLLISGVSGLHGSYRWVATGGFMVGFLCEWLGISGGGNKGYYNAILERWESHCEDKEMR